MAKQWCTQVVFFPPPNNISHAWCNSLLNVELDKLEIMLSQQTHVCI